MNEVTRIVAIRHGETDWNAQSRLQGQLDIPLNPHGQRQAARLADALRHEGLVAVISSDLARAHATAAAFTEPLGLPLRLEPGLRERGFGMLEGKTYEEIDRLWPDHARRWRERDIEFTPLGGESLLVFQQRVVAIARELAALHGGGTIALVTHGGVLDCLYRAAQGIDLQAHRTWQLGNAAINRLLHSPQGLAVVGWNDRSHLEGIVRNESQP